MNENAAKEERHQEALIILSIVVPIIGIIASLRYLFKGNKRQALAYFLYGLLGLALEVLLHFVTNGFSIQNSLFDLSTSGFKSGYAGVGVISAFLVFDFVEDLNIKLVGIWTLISSVLFILISAFKFASLTNYLAAIPQTLVFILFYLIFQKKIKKWIAFVLGLAISLVWSLALFTIISVLFNI